MSPSSRFLVSTLAVLLCTVPVQAQNRAQSTDVSGVAPQSDVSGAITQSDLSYFQSDDARIRLNDIAAKLSRALEQGRLGRSLGAGSASADVSPEMAGLFLAKASRSSSRSFAQELTSHGLPKTSANRLGQSLVGLLDEGTVDPDQLVNALYAFNAAVDAAPASFLVQPPPDFLLVRSVLTNLLRGSVDG